MEYPYMGMVNRAFVAVGSFALLGGIFLLWPGGFGWVRVIAAVALAPVLVLAWNRPPLKRPYRFAIAVWGAAACALFLTSISVELFGQGLIAGVLSAAAGFPLVFGATRNEEPRKRLPGRETVDLASLVGAAATRRTTRT